MDFTNKISKEMEVAPFEVYIGEIGLGKMGTTQQHPSDLNFAKLFDSLDRSVFWIPYMYSWFSTC